LLGYACPSASAATAGTAAVARDQPIHYQDVFATLYHTLGINPSTLHAIKLKLVAFAKRAELFPLADFAMPEAQGRNHPLLVEDDDGYGLYLTIGLPGKEAAPHDHGIWCANAAISGRERHMFYRRIDGAVWRPASICGSGLGRAP
jgi:predicted metal-dependent enzyme (double-stranded beta helix superfamily)